MNRNISRSESFYVGPLERAWMGLVTDALDRGDQTAVRALSAFWSEHQYRVLYHVRETIAELVGPQESDPPLTPEEWREVDATLDKILDLRPPSKASKEEIRPIWPMTLAQLRAQVEQELGPIQNPAPIVLKEYGRSGSLSFNYQVPKRRISRTDHLAVEGMAWNKAAPEGFPPIPRKGGVYSKHEANAIAAWIRDQWPVMREIKNLAAQRDREMMDGRVDPSMFRRMNSVSDNADNFSHWLNQSALHYRDLDKIYAEGMTPKELWMATLEYARGSLLPAYDAIRDFDFKLLKKWSDPDAHMSALLHNKITRSYFGTRGAATNFYGLDSYHADWMKPLVGRNAAPTDYLVGPDYQDGIFSGERGIKLSVLLSAQKAAEKAKEDKDAARKQTLKRLAPSLAPLVGRNVNRARLQAVLPPGYRVEEMGLLTTLYGPGDEWLEGAREATVTKSYAELIRKVVEG